MRVQSYRIWKCILALLAIALIWTLCVRERRDKLFSIASALTYSIHHRFGGHCLVDYMDNLPLVNRKKIILYIGSLGPGMKRILQFEGCDYSNCIVQYCNDVNRYAHLADAVIFDYNSYHVGMSLPQKPLRFVYCAESQAMSFNKWSSVLNDLNGTMTYWQSSSPGSVGFGRTIPLGPRDPRPTITNYAINKTKGAFVYVSNCRYTSYNRLDVIKQLSKYVDVDVFGTCVGNQPCPKRFDSDCEAKLHSQYRFYLAFENSLCKEYITEKFWRGLESTEHFVPVALGGLSMSEYSAIAPPNSFIHAYNFTSIEKLGLHLKSLTTNDAAYNKYHEWRMSFVTTMAATKKAICSFCEALNNPEMLKPNLDRRFADEWNNPQNCRKWD